jgi:hypothetical protein
VITYCFTFVPGNPMKMPSLKNISPPFIDFSLPLILIVFDATLAHYPIYKGKCNF